MKQIHGQKIKDTDSEKYCYSGYDIGFDSRSLFFTFKFRLG